MPTPAIKSPRQSIRGRNVADRTATRAARSEEPEQADQPSPESSPEASIGEAEPQIDGEPIPTDADRPPTRDERVRAAAYRRFVARGGENGNDVEDWLEAEREVDLQDEAASRG